MMNKRSFYRAMRHLLKHFTRTFPEHKGMGIKDLSEIILKKLTSVSEFHRRAEELEVALRSYQKELEMRLDGAQEDADMLKKEKLRVEMELHDGQKAVRMSEEQRRGILAELEVRARYAEMDESAAMARLDMMETIVMSLPVVGEPPVVVGTAPAFSIKVNKVLSPDEDLSLPVVGEPPVVIGTTQALSMRVNKAPSPDADPRAVRRPRD